MASGVACTREQTQASFNTREGETGLARRRVDATVP